MTTIRCPRCAETLPAEARFCRRCGLALSQVPASASGMPHALRPAETPSIVAVRPPQPETPALQTTKPEEEETSENERLLIFSDAVVAFTLTLAVIPLKIPKDLEHFQTSAFAAELGLYLFGFVLIAGVWRTHHTLFQYIQRNTGWLITLNALFLLMIVCVPVAFIIIFIGLSGDPNAPSTQATFDEGLLLFLGAQFGANLVLLLLWVGARARPEALFGARAPAHLLCIYLTWKLGWQLLGFVVYTIAFFLLVSVWFLGLGLALVFVGLRWLVLFQYRRRHRHDLDLLVGSEDTGRVQLFSDAIFAIAITITIAQIDPLTEARENFSLLGTYVFSFLLLGTYWLLHYRLFHLVRRLTPALIRWNFVFLLLVILTFIPARLYTSHMHESRYSVIFSAYQVVTAGVFWIIWQYTKRHQTRYAPAPFFLKAETTPQQIRRLSWVVSANPAIFLVLIIIAVFAPLLTTLYLLAYFALLGVAWLLGHLSTRPVSRHAERAVMAPVPPGAPR